MKGKIIGFDLNNNKLIILLDEVEENNRIIPVGARINIEVL